MAYDVFISYAHVDDKPLPGATKGWVTTFVSGLKSKLAQELGRREAFQLWMDYELRGNDAITPKIHEILDGAGSLVLFLSNGYVASRWCQEELSRFVERVGSNCGRIFVVYHSPVPVKVMPKPLIDLKHYQFWHEDETGTPRTLAVPVPYPTERTYYNQQEDLARDLAKIISDLRPTEQQKVTGNTSLRPSITELAALCKYVVFVNAGDDDLVLVREIADCLLSQKLGFVLPLAAVPGFDPDQVRAAELRRDRDRNLKICDAVLMLYRNGPINQVREHICAWHTSSARRKGGVPELALFQENPDHTAVGVYYPPKMKVRVMPELRAQDCVQQFAEEVASGGETV